MSTQCQGYGWVPNCVGITNCLELLIVLLALRRFRGRLLGKDVLVLYGQNGDLCVYQPAMRFTLPMHVASRSSPPPLESEASEVASCHPHPRSVQSGGQQADSSNTSWGVETPSPGSPAYLESVWSCSGRPVCISRNFPLPVVLLPIRVNARHGCTGTQLSPGLAQICVPPVSLLAKTLCNIREDMEQVMLVAPYWPSRTWFPELMILAIAPPLPIPLRKDLLSQRRGTLWHPRPDFWKLQVWSLDGKRRFKVTYTRR